MPNIDICFNDESDYEYATLYGLDESGQETNVHPQNTAHLFSHIHYEKKSEAIKEKIKEKIAALHNKISERLERVTKLRAEHGITDAVLTELLMQARKAQQRNEARMSYTASAAVGSGQETGKVHTEVTVGAGVINNLLTESDFIESERTQIKTLELMFRNLEDLPDERLLVDGKLVYRGHSLSAEALEYLGF